MNPLKELLELAQKREELERQTLKTVAKARAEKHSWQAIANVIGGTKQAAQQRYGKAVEPLMEQGKYDCSCGWTIVYPGWEAEEATEDITDHERMHEDEHERDEYGTEPANLEAAEEATGQLPAETAIFLDGTAPAKPFRPGLDLWTETPNIDAAEQAAAPKMAEGTSKHAPALDRMDYEYEWQNPEPRRTAAPWVELDHDSEADMDRVESGELDTGGNTIDWSGRGAPQCLYCGKTHHYEGKGRNRYFWIYPGCNPTHRDRQFAPKAPNGQ